MSSEPELSRRDVNLAAAPSLFAALVAFVAAGMACAAPAEVEATMWTRGEKLWEFRFTKEEMEAARPRMERGIVWLADDGMNGDGAILCAATNGMRGTQNFWRPLDVNVMAGTVLLEADVKGRNIERGKRSHEGPKAYLHYTLPPGPPSTNRYICTPMQYGSFDWGTWCVVHKIPAEAKGLQVGLTLQGCPGEFWVDAIRIYRAKEVPASEVKPPDEIPGEAKIPRGRYAKNPRQNARRGVACGLGLTEPDFAELERWGANLIRIPMSVKLDGIETDEQFFEAFAKRLDSTAVALESCRRHGLQVCLLMCSLPGTVKTKQAAYMIPEGYDTTLLRRAWRMVVERFGNDPVVYGYDIMNEPSCAPAEWRRIFTEVVAEVRKLDRKTPVITESTAYYYPPEMNVVYSPHIYQPHALTHCGVLSDIHWSYPGYINGVWWDRRQMRVNLEPLIRFQCEHPDARIYVGEFSCIGWVPGAAEWIADMISLWEEYGWDWTYHSFREWQAWNVELEPEKYFDFNPHHMKPAKDGARRRVLLEGLSRNRPQAGK